MLDALEWHNLDQTVKVSLDRRADRVVLRASVDFQTIELSAPAPPADWKPQYAPAPSAVSARLRRISPSLSGDVPSRLIENVVTAYSGARPGWDRLGAKKAKAIYIGHALTQFISTLPEATQASLDQLAGDPANISVQSKGGSMLVRIGEHKLTVPAPPKGWKPRGSGAKVLGDNWEYYLDD
jgi:hypothetical protein